MKRCSRCGEEKPLTEFTKDKQKRDGHRPDCRACLKASRPLVSQMSPEEHARKLDWQRAWKKAKPESVRAHSERTYVKHHASRLKRAKDYRQKNSDRIDAYFRELYRAKPDRVSAEKKREYARAHHARNAKAIQLRQAADRAKRPEVYKATQKRWARANAKKLLAKQAKRRAKMLGLQNDLTIEQWEERLAEFDGYCAYCLEPMAAVTQDHFRPVAEGGAHTLENVVPACKSCNSRKSDLLIFDWVRRVGVCQRSNFDSLDHSSRRLAG